MHRLLCYGDSNTYGLDPDTGFRHDEEHRWTSLLGHHLPGWCVVEEGLCGRNSGLDDPVKAIRNGMQFLPVALSSHRPLDMVVLMLGSNDFKSYFHQTAEMVAERVATLAFLVRDYDYGPYVPPRILVVSPIVMTSPALLTRKFDEESLRQSARYPKVLEAICQTADIPFFDASLVCKAGSDGQHMDAKNHALLSEALLPLIVYR